MPGFLLPISMETASISVHLPRYVDLPKLKILFTIEILRRLPTQVEFPYQPYCTFLLSDD